MVTESRPQKGPPPAMVLAPASPYLGTPISSPPRGAGLGACPPRWPLEEQRGGSANPPPAPRGASGLRACTHHLSMRVWGPLVVPRELFCPWVKAGGRDLTTGQWAKEVMLSHAAPHLPPPGPLLSPPGWPGVPALPWGGECCGTVPGPARTAVPGWRDGCTGWCNAPPPRRGGQLLREVPAGRWHGLVPGWNSQVLALPHFPQHPQPSHRDHLPFPFRISLFPAHPGGLPAAASSPWPWPPPPWVPAGATGLARRQGHTCSLG